MFDGQSHLTSPGSGHLQLGRGREKDLDLSTTHFSPRPVYMTMRLIHHVSWLVIKHTTNLGHAIVGRNQMA
jgi:hypothetical protein